MSTKIEILRSTASGTHSRRSAAFAALVPGKDEGWLSHPCVSGEKSKAHLPEENGDVSEATRVQMPDSRICAEGTTVENVCGGS